MKKKYFSTLIGLNSRLDTIQAAILLAKLKIFQSEIKKRKKIAKFYNSNITLNKYILSKPNNIKNTENIYSQYCIRVKNRKNFYKYFLRNGINLQIYYPEALPFQAVFNNLNCKKIDFSNSILASKQIISLPINPYLSLSNQNKIVKLIKEYNGNYNLY